MPKIISYLEMSETYSQVTVNKKISKATLAEVAPFQLNRQNPSTLWRRVCIKTRTRRRFTVKHHIQHFQLHQESTPQSDYDK